MDVLQSYGSWLLWVIFIGGFKGSWTLCGTNFGDLWFESEIIFTITVAFLHGLTDEELSF
jgi:hypothetical protein